MRTITVNFGWNTISEKYTLTCQKCEKHYERTASAGYNDRTSAESRMKYRDRLKEEARRLSQQNDFVCDACRKSKLRTPEPIAVQQLLGFDPLPALDDLATRQAAIDAAMEEITSVVSAHNGRLFAFSGEIYEQQRAGYCPYNRRFEVMGYRVSKRKPWETTDNHISAPLQEIAYLDETMQSRRDAAGEAKP